MQSLRIPRTSSSPKLAGLSLAVVGHAWRHRKRKYFATPIRTCRDQAIALVKFVGVAAPRRVCGRHAQLEATDRPREIEWFEDLRVREHHPSLELLETVAVNRAPMERSWDTPETRQRRRQGGDP